MNAAADCLCFSMRPDHEQQAQCYLSDPVSPLISRDSPAFDSFHCVTARQSLLSWSLPSRSGHAQPHRKPKLHLLPRGRF